MHYAAYNNKTGVMNLLIESHTDVLQVTREPKGRVNEHARKKFGAGRTALHVAAMAGGRASAAIAPAATDLAGPRRAAQAIGPRATRSPRRRFRWRPWTATA